MDEDKDLLAHTPHHPHTPTTRPPAHPLAQPSITVGPIKRNGRCS